MASSNSEKKTASSATDTSFRRTWDTTEYAAKAAARETSERETAALRAEARAAGKTYHAPPSIAPTTMASARTSRLDVSSHVGRTQIISGAMAGVTKRGKGAGFWCEDCDLTFKDNLQWVEHLNSKQHAVNTGGTGEVERVGVEGVKERLAWLWERKVEEEREKAGEGMGLDERLRVRIGEEEKEREERREKRRERRRREREEKEGGKGDGDGGGEAGEGDGEDEMMKMMGFGGFGSTAKA